MFYSTNKVLNLHIPASREEKLQAINSSMTTSSWKTERNLERIINEPLECCECTDHHYPDRQSVPETRETDVTVDPRHCLACTLSSFAF